MGGGRKGAGQEAGRYREFFAMQFSFAETGFRLQLNQRAK
jgi:hypothetical protein